MVRILKDEMIKRLVKRLDSLNKEQLDKIMKVIDLTLIDSPKFIAIKDIQELLNKIEDKNNRMEVASYFLEQLLNNKESEITLREFRDGIIVYQEKFGYEKTIYIEDYDLRIITRAFGKTIKFKEKNVP